MSSYYKKINGKNYDRAMLEVADKSVAGKGDGRISLSDAKAIIKKAKDGGKITDTELRTLNYILEKYKFTEPALKYVEDSLSDTLVLKEKEISDHKKPEQPQVESQREIQKEDKPLAEKKEAKTNNFKYFFILLCLFIILAAFLLFDFFCKKNTFLFCKKDTVLAEKNDEIAPVTNEEEKIEEKIDEKIDENIDKTNENSQNNVKSDKNEYVVKQYDTLVKISDEVYGNYRFWKDIYNANKDKIKNPVFIYPGQVLVIPEKNK